MDDEVFMTRSLIGTSKTTEQNLIVRIVKSETEVINNKRLRSTVCMPTIGATAVCQKSCNKMAAITMQSHYAHAIRQLN